MQSPQVKWMPVPEPIPIGEKVEHDGKQRLVLRCDPDGTGYMLTLVDPPDVQFVDGMSELLRHLPE